jgi:hypothetical protein
LRARAIRRSAFTWSLILLLASTSFILGDGLFAKLKDPEDGAFDLSDFLLSRTGFLPVPIIITEPAVGYGGGLAPFFIKRNPPTAEDTERGRFPTPTVYGAGGFGTENGSWGAFGAYLLPFSGDRYRWSGAVVYVDLNLNFFGFGPDSPLQNNPASFAIKAGGTFQRFQARVGSSDLFAGIQYLYLNTSSRFDGPLPPDIPPRELDVNVGGLGGMLEYDTRDNILSPQHGVDLFADGNAYEPAFGSDSSFGKARIQAVGYGRPAAHWGYGLRLDARYAWGDMPFFMRPTLNMRGLTAGRYLDKVAVLIEAEARYWIDTRWMVLGFGGVGRVAPTWEKVGAADNVPAGGFGFRYLLARKLGLQTGLDFGWGPSGDHAFYIQVGSAWR